MSQLGLCYEAAKHLQTMKDMLISISNELLDNDDLNPEQKGTLRQDRLVFLLHAINFYIQLSLISVPLFPCLSFSLLFTMLQLSCRYHVLLISAFILAHNYCLRAQLNKQIQQLEKHLHTTAVEEEREKSQLSASTAASRTINYETPPAAAFHIDPMRLDTQFHMRSEPDGFDRWNSSYSVPPPVEREPYIPKYIDVKYIEGSNDKRWSSLDFPWTKKLEVCLITH